jgi:hypothetical protein
MVAYFFNSTSVVEWDEPSVSMPMSEFNKYTAVISQLKLKVEAGMECPFCSFQAPDGFGNDAHDDDCPMRAFEGGL